MLKEGHAAPAFRLPTDDGGEISLKDLHGKHVALYFYPKASTPGCTTEAIEISRFEKGIRQTQRRRPGVVARMRLRRWQNSRPSKN